MHVQVTTFACMNFPSFERNENKVVAILKLVVHRDNERNFIAFIADSKARSNQIRCECDTNQEPLYSLTTRRCVEIVHFLIEN